MTKQDDQRALKIAFQVALESRRETFLAYYPRSLKLAISSVFVLAILFFSFMGGGNAPFPQDAAPDSHSSEKASSQKPDQTAETALPQVVSKELYTKKTGPLTEDESKAVQQNNNYNDKRDMMVAPDLALVEKRSYGDLPKIAADGRGPWEVYARPFDQLDPRPRIALVMTDLGLSRIATDAAIHRLPAPVTLAFDVQGASIESWLTRARQDGHETILALPMEPIDYPRNDPGPNTLLMSLPNKENVDRLLRFLAVGTGYVGVTTLSGSRFLSDSEKVNTVLDVLKKRGLLILNPSISSRNIVFELARKKEVPVSIASMIVDETPSPQEIDAVLKRAEKTARLRGSVVVLASPLPLTLERLTPWLNNLTKRGFALAPLSAVVQ